MELPIVGSDYVGSSWGRRAPLKAVASTEMCVGFADQGRYAVGAQARIDDPPGFAMVMRFVVNAVHLPSL